MAGLGQGEGIEADRIWRYDQGESACDLRGFYGWNGMKT